MHLLKKSTFGILVLCMLILCQIGFVNTLLHAQTTFEPATPVFLDTLNLSPTSITFGDLNGDSFTDLVIHDPEKPVEVLLYDPAINYFDTTRHYTLPEALNSRYTVRIYKTDLDQQASDIMFISRRSRANKAFRWDGAAFTSVSLPGSIANLSNVQHISFGDFTGDGLPDIILDRFQGGFPINFSFSNFLGLKDQQAVRLIDSELQSMYEDTYGSYLFDFNKDGHPDLFQINNGIQDRYFAGTPSDFTELTTSGTGQLAHSFGAAVGDYNNDGLLDIYRFDNRFASSFENVLFQNQGNHRFASVQSGFATLDRLDSRNAHWGDYNNDGHLDLAVAEYGSPLNRNNPAGSTLYQNDGTGVLQKQTEEPLLGQLGRWTHISFFDIDRDGDLDMIAAGEQNIGGIVFYLNKGNPSNWLSLKLEQTNQPHPEPYGAKVTIESSEGGISKLQYREFNPVNGYHVQHAPEMHIGLGQAESANITINWPSGNVSVHDFTELNREVTITEPLAGNLGTLGLNENQVNRLSVGDTLVATYRYVNLGKATAQIQSITPNKEYLEVQNFDAVVAPEDTGSVELLIRPFTNAHVGQKTDSLLILSDAVNSEFTLAVENTILTRSAPFSKINTNQTLFRSSYPATKNLWFPIDDDANVDLILFGNSVAPKAWQKSDSLLFTEHSATSTLDEVYYSDGISDDFNMDGQPDLFLISPTNENGLFINEGAFNFQKAPWVGIIGITRNTTAVSSTDVNGDGLTDLILANSSQQRNEILLYRETGRFEPVEAGDFTTQSYNESAQMLFDLNGDGNQDILTFDSATDAVAPIRTYLYSPTSEGSFEFNEQSISSLSTISTPIQGGLAFDMDSDGDSDLLLLGAIQENPLILLRNIGSGIFEPVSSEALRSVTGLINDAAIHDFNLDGFNDLILANSEFSEPNILLESVLGNDYLRISSGEVTTKADQETQTVSVLDLNGNHIPDLFFGNNLSNNELYSDSLITQTGNWLSIKLNYRLANTLVTPPRGTRATLRWQTGSNSYQQLKLIGIGDSGSEEVAPLFYGFETDEPVELTVEVPGLQPQLFTFNPEEFNRLHQIEIASTSNDDPLVGDLPRRFDLLPNYPNPFNPSTIIPFTLPEAGKVSLKVYSLLGQEVRTLIDQRVEAGSHNVRFDAETLPSGIYLSVLVFGERKQVQKMTLIK